MITKIPCAHETGEQPDTRVTVPDYHPLSRTELETLLRDAREQRETNAVNHAAVRLDQAIPGQVCPRMVTGTVFDRELRATDLYWKWIRKGGEMPTDAIYKILTEQSE